METLTRARDAKARLEAAEGAEPIYDDLPTAEAVRDAILKVFSPAASLRRVVFVLGDSGMGKTTAVNILCRKWGQRVTRMEAHEAWADRPANMLDDLLEQLGLATIPTSSAAKMRAAVAALKSFRRCLIIDEGHHIGPRIINTFKSLVNMTPGEIVILGTPPMWAKFTKAAYAEATQLYTNRLGAFVCLKLLDSDVEAFLRSTFGSRVTKAEAASAAKAIRPVAERRGCYAFVRDVCAELEAAGKGFGAEAVQAALREVRDMRSPMEG
jgi:type II secretory pathway predicted ATPase ExeA